MKRILKKVKLQYLYEVNANTNFGLCASADNILTKNEYRLFEDYLYAHLLKGKQLWVDSGYAYPVDNIIDRLKWLNKHYKINE